MTDVETLLAQIQVHLAKRPNYVSEVGGEFISASEFIARDKDLLTACVEVIRQQQEALKQIASIQYNRLDAEQGSLTEHVEIAEAALLLPLVPAPEEGQ